MGTKNNPGAFDCYANADPDEPIFVLLGRDRHAPMLVMMWALQRRAEGEDPAKVHEAAACAGAMEAWRLSLGKPASDWNLADQARRAALYDDLVAALEPFAAAADAYQEETSDDVIMVVYASGYDIPGGSWQKTLTLGQARAARAVLSRAREKQP